MRRKAKALESDDVQVNLTPLIDVVFVVLVSFIMIAPMLELDRIQLAQAGMGSEEVSGFSDTRRKIQIRVLPDNEILLNQESISLRDLERRLIAMKKELPNQTPRLFHDKRAMFGTYQNVKNALEQAGFQELDVILAP